MTTVFIDKSLYLTRSVRQKKAEVPALENQSHLGEPIAQENIMKSQVLKLCHALDCSYCHNLVMDDTQLTTIIAALQGSIGILEHLICQQVLGYHMELRWDPSLIRQICEYVGKYFDIIRIGTPYTYKLLPTW